MKNRTWQRLTTLLLGGALGVLIPAVPAAASFLEFVEAVPMPPELLPAQAASVAVSHDGNNVYVAGGVGNFLVGYQRDPVTGELSMPQTLVNGMDGVEGFGRVGSVFVSPDDLQVFTASTGQGDNQGAVTSFSRNAGSGLLSFADVEYEGLDEVIGLKSAHMVSTGPNGRHVYVASPGDNDTGIPGRISIFENTGGNLTFLGAVTDGEDLVEGLNGVVSVRISPDGRHAYAAAFGADSVVVFERDADTGALTFVQKQTDGVEGVDGLDGATELRTSPDGAQVYAVSIARQGQGENALVTFNRDAITGELTFTNVQFQGMDGIEGMEEPSSIVLTPDGTLAFTTGVGSDSVAIFSRESLTGLLGFEGAKYDGMDGVEGLEAARWADVSADGKHLYVAGLTDAAIAVFAIVPEPTGLLLGLLAIGIFIASRSRHAG